MEKSLGSIKGFCRLTAIRLSPAVEGKRMGMNKWKLVYHNWTFFSCQRNATASNDAMGQPEIRHIWKILEILKSELVNVFGLCAASEEREVNTFKSSVFTLLKSSCSSSRFDRAGFKCLRLFLTGHFCCFGTRTHGIPVPMGHGIECSFTLAALLRRLKCLSTE